MEDGVVPRYKARLKTDKKVVKVSMIHYEDKEIGYLEYSPELGKEVMKTPTFCNTEIFTDEEGV